jgi:hypothetical protein
MDGACEHGYEPSGSIKFWETFEWPSYWWLDKKNAAPLSKLFI